MPQSTLLRDVRDERGSRHLSASLSAEGDLVIQGQDLGHGVEDVYGEGIREYEWAWTVRAADIPALLAALGRGSDVLDGLRDQFSGERAAGLKQFLDDHEITLEVWSRLGD